ncbi:protein TonB [Novosphingobium chloroacetimidivorans]|uniref:Protein TonB n=1 Tax=Novosphingobium chloroacetimidivorans TaxID=1428314 RepID=A0A7W7NV07_9SPHN|nr:energy transducer TonB [Novosphingobium chloroacetimidivorans]MBB4858068.1 protein TonB [Novosphingobium chloroacetimidivorans]
MPDRNKTLAVIAVAGLHGMALYGLVTGLGVEYIDRIATVLRAENIPMEQAPPPPPPPEVTPVEQATTTPLTPRAAPPPPMDARRNPYSANEFVIDVPIRPVEPITFDPPGPSPTPSFEKPAFTPKSVRPRNDPGLWVTTSDYPAASLRRGEQGVARFEVAVGSDGKVTDCRVTSTSGAAELDAATCKYVARRARFDPATDGSGARVSGSYSGSIHWVIP